MLIVAFLALLQVTQTGTVVGLVKLPNGSKPPQPVHVALLPPKYTEMWNKQAQQRLDNYWEIFKPELAVKREHISDILRMVNVEAFRYVTAAMRRELGESASKYIKDAAPNGAFELRGIPLGTYE